MQYHAISFGTRFVGQKILLMKDDGQKHASKLCQSYIKSKAEFHFLQLISWPVQSADLNPTELVKDELDRNVSAKQPTRVA